MNIEDINFILACITIISVCISITQEIIAWSKCKSNSIGQVIHQSIKGIKCIKTQNNDIEIDISYYEERKVKQSI